jgi:hypothetical protein
VTATSADFTIDVAVKQWTLPLTSDSAMSINKHSRVKTGKRRKGSVGRAGPGGPGGSGGHPGHGGNGTTHHHHHDGGGNGKHRQYAEVG